MLSLRLAYALLLCAALSGAQSIPQAGPQSGTSTLGQGDDPSDATPIVNVKPASAMLVRQTANPSVNWPGLFKQSLFFLSVEHGFRLMTEPGTRSGGLGLGKGYLNSLGSLHGWADGDEFVVNYVGHPMQGAVAGYIWAQNDPAYRGVEIGKDPNYWKSRLRATAFSFAYSEQFEIGPLSEASVGHIQRDFPQQGFVDHVATPVIGLGWMMAEDAVDKYILRRLERKVRNPYVRGLARSFMTPSHAMANIVALRFPWQRDDRPGISASLESFRLLAQQRSAKPAIPQTSRLAPFEMTLQSRVSQFSGRPCAGGGGEAAWRISSEWQMVLEVDGCKMMDLRENVSGDALTYRIGPRWTPNLDGRWAPFAHVLVGGAKFTQEEMFPSEKERLELPSGAPSSSTHALYNRSEETNVFSFAAGSGVDLKLNNALALRVASLEITHNWVKSMGGLDYSTGVQFSTGLVLRLGSW